ncbi:ribonuclease D [Kushneria aurantia]|uniref:Ribonuclease D n=1 Tax=Kushneria aurantia TaxID=504092 RepID=A0ABV6G7R6_9GAMM|nr:ribonuclease D [Kushneria aurantia]
MSSNALSGGSESDSVRWYFVDSEAALDSACEALSGCDVIGVDTEFMRETTFYPQPALIQLGSSEEAWLIDPVALSPTPALRRLLGEEGPLKIFHACGEDLEIFQRWMGDVPSPMVDTQLAHALLCDEISISYQRLVAHWMQVHLPKDETRSNWLLRPLSAEQCRYAALDVCWLPALWRRQSAQLGADRRLGWLHEECAALLDSARGERDPDLWYLRHRNAWRLTPRQLAAFQRLCGWREQAVRHRDLPRGWLASDALLMEIAAAMPTNRHELAAIDGVKPGFIKRDGDAVLALVAQAAQFDDQELPHALPSPLDATYKRRMKALKQQVRERAEALSLPPELLATRRDLEKWIAADLHAAPWPFFGGWRGEILNAILVDTLESFE